MILCTLLTVAHFFLLLVLDTAGQEVSNLDSIFVNNLLYIFYILLIKLLFANIVDLYHL
jgi:hypothetical protein